MSKFLFIGSTESMTKYAQEYLRTLGRTDVDTTFFPPPEAARALEYVQASKAQILIARGMVAAELKEKTDCAVVEIVVTAQEMGLLIKRVKAAMKKDCPSIGIVGIARMFCDMRDFDKIFDIRLITSFVETWTGLEPAVDEVIAKGAELIIGGEIVCRCASNRGMPCMFQPDGRDSIEQAIRVADSIAWAADMEKKNAAELRALLDFSSNGIIKTDNAGFVVSFNNRALSLLEKTGEEVEGRNIRELIDKLEEPQMLDDVFTNRQEAFFTFWHTTGSALAVNVAPLLVDSTMEGAMFSFHVINKLKQMEVEARRDLYQNARDSEYNWLPALFVENMSFLHSAKKFAQYDECVLLLGGHAIEREMTARYMHDVSLRQEASFIYMTGAHYTLETEKGNPDDAFLSPEVGTIFIDEIEHLSASAQHHLTKLLGASLSARHMGDTHNVQIIAGSQIKLAQAVRKGAFREDLYHILSALALDVPSLANCPNEIRNWLNHFMQQYSDMYSNYVHITKAARAAILAHPWKGGLAELRSFCCKAMINTPKNVLDESTALRFLRNSNLYETDDIPRKDHGFDANPEVSRLKFLIEKYDGNRSMIADEMHISVTTLWRRMKKYGLL